MNTITATKEADFSRDRVIESTHEMETLDHLKHVIDHAAHLLPAQGPITVFIHHNTLHAFEDLPFLEGVRKGAGVFGYHPFLTEERYRDALSRGRIRFSDLDAVLNEDMGEAAEQHVVGLCTRRELRGAMLQYPIRSGPPAELRWFMAETDALKRVRGVASAAARGRLISETRRWVMRDLRGGYESPRNGLTGSSRKHRMMPADTLMGLIERYSEQAIENWDDKTWEEFTLQILWRVCRDGVAKAPPGPPADSPPVRHRDLILQAAGVDIDPWIHDVLVRFCAAFLDQGFAHWTMPARELGFYRAFCDLYRRSGGPPDRWLAGLARELKRLEDSHFGPLESIRESLTLLGVGEDEWDEYLPRILLALRGWAGMVRQVEIRKDSVAHPIPNGSLIEFLAVRLILERLAVEHAAREAWAFRGLLSDVRTEARKRTGPTDRPDTEQRAFAVFSLAQLLGWAPDRLYHLSDDEWAKLLHEIESFSSIERRQTFHLAYERRFLTQSLDALALHSTNATDRPRSPRFQAVTCLDEREESFRRHLEEIAPDAETFGAAGFFAVPMYYRGSADAHFVPLCPIVLQPKHWVREHVDESQLTTGQRREKTRLLLGRASHQFHLGSRTAAFGAVLATGVGVLASIPLVARILFPRLTARIRRRVGRVVQPPPATRLQLERKDAEPGPENGHLGFSVEEMVSMADRLLCDIGLVDGFARLVFVLGHGSFSLNNPHKSAYDCGACGGSSGAPNGRALAFLMNDRRVRVGLARRGISIPESTVFVGGFHNTTNDSVTLFDTDRVPETHRGEFETCQRELERACERNAHERCRRFMSAPLTLSFPAARQHVEGRSEDLAQTRPELGHATNALCVVGRRKWTRGLYLDRRAFLTSYDPTRDDAEASILARTLGAVFPVCGGINLEYYFSHVDSPGYGCGTKLPHNVTGLLGVMDGAASDLRTGLPWQMVEIHEPVRLLVVCETTVGQMLGIMDRNPMIGNMARNGWVRLAVLHPRTAELHLLHGGEFRPYSPQAEKLPTAASSVDWYRGWREHLEFAEIER